MHPFLSGQFSIDVCNWVPSVKMQNCFYHSPKVPSAPLQSLLYSSLRQPAYHQSHWGGFECLWFSYDDPWTYCLCLKSHSCAWFCFPPDPSQSELMGEPHLMVEHKLGLLWCGCRAGTQKCTYSCLCYSLAYTTLKYWWDHLVTWKCVCGSLVLGHE